MADTYHQIYIQAVFGVKYRKALLEKAWREQMFAVIGNLINETRCKNYIVNGVEDHVHCFFGLKPTLAPSEVMQSIKAKSSKWLNEEGLLKERFEWQRGYGIFSYSQSAKDNVYKYIERQEEYHKNKTFREEYTGLLQAFEIEYKEEYVLDDLI
jgi:putative transposase